MKNYSFKLSQGVLWCLMVAAPIPFFLLLFHFLSGLQKLDALEEEMQRIHTRSSQMQELQRKESTLLAALKHFDPHYIEKNVESLIFLVPDVKKCETLQSENTEDEQISKRLQFLKEGGNRLVFSEEQTRANEIFRETEERQQHSVEMNEEDLKKLLCLIEGTTIWPYGPKEGRPQLIIKEFTLSKKEISPQNKVYIVSMQLIKRENLESSL